MKYGKCDSIFAVAILCSGILTSLTSCTSLDSSFTGNWQGSGKADDGQKFEFTAQVIPLGEDKYRIDTFDSHKRLMHALDGVLAGDKFVYTADNGLYQGEGVLSGDVFHCFYKGPVNGKFEMHRIAGPK